MSGYVLILALVTFSILPELVFREIYARTVNILKTIRFLSNVHDINLIRVEI